MVWADCSPQNLSSSVRYRMGIIIVECDTSSFDHRGEHVLVPGPTASVSASARTVPGSPKEVSIAMLGPVVRD